MTPSEYVEQLATLVGAERHEEAVALAIRLHPEMRPLLSIEEFVAVHDLMHIADTAVDLAAWVAAREFADAPARD